jgi:hypothetical protein
MNAVAAGHACKVYDKRGKDNLMLRKKIEALSHDKLFVQQQQISQQAGRAKAAVLFYHFRAGENEGHIFSAQAHELCFADQIAIRQTID